MKKLISVSLIFLMVLSLFSVNLVFAAETNDPYSVIPSAWFDEVGHFQIAHDNKAVESMKGNGDYPYNGTTIKFYDGTWAAWVRYNNLSFGKDGADTLYIKSEVKPNTANFRIIVLEPNTEIVKNGNDYANLNNGFLFTEERAVIKATLLNDGAKNENGYYELSIDKITGNADIVFYCYISNSLYLTDFYFGNSQAAEPPTEIPDGEIEGDFDAAGMPEKVLDTEETLTISGTLKNAAVDATLGRVIIGTKEITGGKIIFGENGGYDVADNNNIKIKEGTKQSFLSKAEVNTDTYIVTIVANGGNYNNKEYDVKFNLGTVFNGNAKFTINVTGVPQGVEITRKGEL